MSLKLSDLIPSKYKRKGDYDIIINEKDNVEIVIVDNDYSFAVYKNGNYVRVPIYSQIENDIVDLAKSYGYEVYHSSSSSN